MRALIKAEIIDPNNNLLARENREEYDKKIISLFKKIGYDPRSIADKSVPTQKDLQESKEVVVLFENVQDEIKNEEMKHLVMLGYTSHGRAKFVVCSINKNTLHIRVRDDLFESLRKACAEICDKTWKHSAKQHKRRLHQLFSNKNYLYIKLNDEIEVMEPTHKTATILGHLIRHSLQALLKYHKRESFLAIFTLVAAVILFWFTPELAPPLTTFLTVMKNFQVVYVQGAMERIYSALFVTSAVIGVELFIKYMEFKKGHPIMWNAGIEPTHNSGIVG